MTEGTAQATRRHLGIGRFGPQASPWLTAAALAVGDLTALALAMLGAVHLRLFYDGKFEPVLFLSLWPLLFLFLGAFAAMGLYRSIAANPADELRRMVQTLFLGFLAVGSITYLSGNSDAYSRGVFVIALALAAVAVPLNRVVVRWLFRRSRWWGAPCVILGDGPAVDRLARSLLAQPGIGLRPVAVLADGDRAHAHSLPVLPVDQAPELARLLRIPYCLMLLPEDRERTALAMADREAEQFPHLVLVPEVLGDVRLWVEATDVGGNLGLAVRRRLLMPVPRLIKRGLDLLLTVLGGILILPLIGLFALAITLDSRGPVFYSQRRLGTGGRHFRAWKFRSMVRDADVQLAAHLAAHPELREEWERDHKLKDDPRITRVGRILRRTSLDELPQLWNVLWGEMSLVGPRPIVDAEIGKYGDLYHLYSKVRPGMSGLWQVSGRSDTDYGQRVGLDAYYVRNWSVWLDLYILARTVKTVLLGKGAY